MDKSIKPWVSHFYSLGFNTLGHSTLFSLLMVISMIYKLNTFLPVQSSLCFHTAFSPLYLEGPVPCRHQPLLFLPFLKLLSDLSHFPLLPLAWVSGGALKLWRVAMRMSSCSLCPTMQRKEHWTSFCLKLIRKYLSLGIQGQYQSDCQKVSSKKATVKVKKEGLLNKVCCDQATDNSKQGTHKPSWFWVLNSLIHSFHNEFMEHWSNTYLVSYSSPGIEGNVIARAAIY